MDPMTVSPQPQILVLEPEDSDEIMDDFPTDFLKAQTRSFRRGSVAPEDMDWDSYVISNAADCTSPIETANATSVEIGHQISDICVYLVDVFGDLRKYTKLLSYRGEAAQDLLDLLQKLLDHAPLDPRFRAIVYVALVRLCRKSELYPRCFSLEDVVVDRNNYPVSSGGFGEVYIGSRNGIAVCVKIVRLYQSSNQSQLYKAFTREAVVWGQLSHPNILPFFGIYRLGDIHNRLCLVSPWMHNGNIADFLLSRPHFDRTPLISDVASGLTYLHENGVVHGDLKSLNILVTDSRRACLADFGLSYVSDADGLQGNALSSNHAEAGTQGFEAPELVDPDLEYTKKTTASDVYAFGMVCYEMLTGEVPFGKVKRVAVIRKIMSGQHPTRPAGDIYLERGLTKNMWTIMTRCWSQLPQDRPTAAQLVQYLPPDTTEHTEGWTRTHRPGFNSTNVDVTITNALPHLKLLVI